MILSSWGMVMVAIRCFFLMRSQDNWPAGPLICSMASTVVSVFSLGLECWPLSLLMLNSYLDLASNSYIPLQSFLLCFLTLRLVSPLLRLLGNSWLMWPHPFGELSLWWRSSQTIHLDTSFSHCYFRCSIECRTSLPSLVTLFIARQWAFCSGIFSSSSQISVEEEKLKFYITFFSCLCNSACPLQSLDHVGHVVSESGDLQY